MANNLGCQLDRTWDQLIPKLCSPPTGDSLNQVMEAGRATLNLGGPSGGSPEKRMWKMEPLLFARSPSLSSASSSTLLLQA